MSAFVDSVILPALIGGALVMTTQDYDGGICPEDDMREGYMIVEWYVAAWRDEAFGLRSVNHPMVRAAIDRTMGDDYLIGGRSPSLPSGSDRSWRRGTWATVPWARDQAQDRWNELWAETHP